MTCCLPGYIYNSGTHRCDISGGPSSDPVPCQCCPIGYSFINGAGEFLYSNNNYIPITNTPPDKFFNTCARIVNGAFATTGAVAPAPIACPCCRSGFIWHSDIQACVDLADPKHWIDPMPCVVCVCPDPPPPPECEGCTNRALPVAFPFNNTIKGCKDCGEDISPRITGKKKYDTFIADRLLDPIIFFKLKQ